MTSEIPDMLKMPFNPLVNGRIFWHSIFRVPLGIHPHKSFDRLTLIILSSDAAGFPLPSLLLVVIYSMLSGPRITSLILPNCPWKCSLSDILSLSITASYKVWPRSPPKNIEFLTNAAPAGAQVVNEPECSFGVFMPVLVSSPWIVGQP